MNQADNNNSNGNGFPPKRREKRDDSHIAFCRFYLEPSGCSFGNTCRYPHIDQGASYIGGGRRAPVLPSAGYGGAEIVSLVVQNVPPGTKGSDMFTLFTFYGTVKDVRLTESFDAYGVAYVDMLGKDSAANAMFELNRPENPNKLRVNLKNPNYGGAVRGGMRQLPTLPTAQFRPMVSLPYSGAGQDGNIPYKYKEMPCKYFGSMGGCNKGADCTFAHGEFQEIVPFGGQPMFSSDNNSFPNTPREKRPLTPDQTGPKFKTMPCSMFPKGLCVYGDKCIFIH